jgi:transposase-like protein
MFADRHLDREVILLCVRWYLRYKLSLRDLVEMMAERRLELAHTTIMRVRKELTGVGYSGSAVRLSGCGGRI